MKVPDAECTRYYFGLHEIIALKWGTVQYRLFSTVLQNGKLSEVDSTLNGKFPGYKLDQFLENLSKIEH